MILAGLALLTLAPAVAHGEPAGPTGHLPILWALVFVGAVVSGAVPLLIGKYAKLNLPKWAFWLAAIVVAGLFAGIIGPIIVAIGSILVTGRTM